MFISLLYYECHDVLGIYPQKQFNIHINYIHKTLNVNDKHTYI